MLLQNFNDLTGTIRVGALRESDKEVIPDHHDVPTLGGAGWFHSFDAGKQITEDRLDRFCLAAPRRRSRPKDDRTVAYQERSVLQKRRIRIVVVSVEGDNG